MSPDQRLREGKPWAYSDGEVEVYRDLEHIRRRPGMYIGSTDARGLHQLVEGLLTLPLKQARTGNVTQIELELRGDGGCRVSDNGPGLSIERDPRHEGRTQLELMLTEVFVPGLPHFINYSVASAVSERLVVEIARAGFVWRQEFRRGERSSDLLQGETTATTGSSFTFWLDPVIFNDARFDADRLRERLRELAFLNPSLRIHWIDSRTQPPVTEQFTYPKGLAAYLSWLNRGQRLLHPTIFHFRETVDGESVEVAAQWIDLETSREVSFANYDHTSLGGTHLTGFRTGVTQAINQFASAGNFLRLSDPKFVGEDYRSGLVAAIAVYMHDLRFDHAFRQHINNPELIALVSESTRRQLADFLQRHPDDARAILAKAITARDARLAAADIRRQKRR